ncbi:fibronectin type III domain-containing protein, partial [Coraliomargarita parva]|uniref:fibronectin type III domain-containing protein n=1 Tax=Coraliomargarita parva TaxID=3014050 RepID=UPI0022B3DF1E
YYYVVTALDTNFNESTYSSEANATPVDTTPPAAPGSFSASAGDGSVSLDWADNSEPDMASYSVYRSTTSGSGYAAIATGLTSSDYVDNAVSNGTTYYYVVTALDTNANESSNSSEASATPLNTTPPAAPTGLSLTVGEGYIDLDWDDNSESDFDSYILFRSTISGSGYTAIATGHGASSYMDYGVSNGTTYYYVVQAIDIANNYSALSTELGATPVAAPSVSNAGFESPSTSTYIYQPGGGSWTFGTNTGVTANGSAFTAGNPNAPEGSQVAFVQSTGSISMNVSGFTSGRTYTITFSAAERGNWGGAQTWDLRVDGSTVQSYAPGQSATNYVDYTATFTASSTSHSIAFVGTAWGDNTVLLDDVRISVNPWTVEE